MVDEYEDFEDWLYAFKKLAAEHGLDVIRDPEFYRKYFVNRDFPEYAFNCEVDDLLKMNGI